MTNLDNLEKELANRGITVSNIEKKSDSIIINGKSKNGNDSNMNAFFSLFPEGTLDGKDVMFNLSESTIPTVRLFEETPHPDLIETGMRVTIDHKTFGEISVIVKKIKKYSSSNQLDGFYWSSERKGIMGFASFDNIKRLYNPNNAGKGKSPSNWDNKDLRNQFR